MYGKIFESIYEGTLYGQWEAIVTMQQLIVLANADGVIDMTPAAISGKTSIPLDIIEKGLDILSRPDPHSRTPGLDGVRIQLLEDHRDWGWFLVNHEKYMAIKKREDKQKADRERIANKRKSLNEQGCRKVSQSVANVAHIDEDIDEDEDIFHSPSESAQEADKVIWKTGVELLGGKKSARSLIGKWVSEYGKEKVAATIAQAAVQRPVEPKAYITAALQERVQPTDPYFKQLSQAISNVDD